MTLKLCMIVYLGLIELWMKNYENILNIYIVMKTHQFFSPDYCLIFSFFFFGQRQLRTKYCHFSSKARYFNELSAKKKFITVSLTVSEICVSNLKKN